MAIKWHNAIKFPHVIIYYITSTDIFKMFFFNTYGILTLLVICFLKILYVELVSKLQNIFCIAALKWHTP